MPGRGRDLGNSRASLLAGNQCNSGASAPLCACGNKLQRNAKRCVPCRLGWTAEQRLPNCAVKAKALSGRLEKVRLRSLNVASRVREQTESEKRAKALASLKAERQERAQLQAKIVRDDEYRASMAGRLSIIRAAATARQRRAKGL